MKLTNRPRRRSSGEPSSTVGGATVAPYEVDTSSFLTNVVATIAGNMASPLIGIATAPILAHALGVEGRGQFSAATSPALLLTLAGTLGLPEAATYFVASQRMGARSVLRRVVVLSLVSGIVLAVALAILAPRITSGEPQVTRLIIIGGCSLPAALAVGALRGVVAGLGRWRLVNLEQYFSNGLRLALVALLAVTGRLDLATGVAVYLACPVLGAVVYFPFLKTEAFDAAHVVAKGASTLLLRYGTVTWIGGLSGILLYRLDQVLMAPLAGARTLGLYAAAVAIGELPHVVSGATRAVMLAAEAARADDDRVQTAARLTLLASGIVAALIAAAAPAIVRVAFGAEFRDATSMLRLLLLAAVVYAPGSVAGSVLLARGRPGARSLALVAATSLNVALVLILVPRFGGDGAAFASVLSYGLYSLVNLYLVSHYFHISVYSLVVIRKTDMSGMLRRVQGMRSGSS